MKHQVSHFTAYDWLYDESIKEVYLISSLQKKGKRNVQRVLQSQAAALPRQQEEEETDKTKQAQIE